MWPAQKNLKLKWTLWLIKLFIFGLNYLLFWNFIGLRSYPKCLINLSSSLKITEGIQTAHKWLLGPFFVAWMYILNIKLFGDTKVEKKIWFRPLSLQLCLLCFYFWYFSWLFYIRRIKSYSIAIAWPPLQIEKLPVGGQLQSQAKVLKKLFYSPNRLIRGWI